MPASTGVFDYFDRPELPTPALTAREAADLLRAQFGLDARLDELGSNQDQNFLVLAAAGGAPLGVLKLSNPVFSQAEVALQDLASDRVRRRHPQVRTPAVVIGPHGPLEGWWQTTAGRLHARVISFLPGRTLTGSHHLRPAVVSRMGELAASVSTALAGIDHPAASRVLQWDLRHAERVIDLLRSTEPDAAVRAAVDTARRRACAALAPVRERLPIQLGHFDVTDDNTLAPAPGALPDAIIDFGDAASSWAVGELAVTVSSLLHHDGADAVTVLPAVRSFDGIRPLHDDEITALWPLVVLRACVLVLSGRQQVRLQSGNEYAAERLGGEWTIFERATALPLPVATDLIRSALGRDVLRPRWPHPAVLPSDVAVAVLDAAVIAGVHDDGAWCDRGALDGAVSALDEAASALLRKGEVAVAVPAGRAVLTGAPMYTPTAPATIPTGTTLWLARTTPLSVPDGAEVRTDADGIELRTPTATLRFAFAPTPAGAESAVVVESTVVESTRSAGAAELPARTPVRVTLTRPDGAATGIHTTPPGEDRHVLPPAVTAASLPGWRGSFGDPAAALGMTPLREAADGSLARRRAVLAEVQEHYYTDPPRIERGWREHLIDTDARVYLDMVNNVASVGHAHPRLAAAVSRQARLLNTNSRFHYDAVGTFAERLTATLPDGLDTVFLVNSGSEAVDLALRLAMAATGRSDVVAMREAYHGWTYASDAVSTSIADNPGALETRPPWVHTVDAANSYRGIHRGADAVRYAPEAARVIDDLAAQGRPAAAFVCEPFFGNAGGLALPDGYLTEVYAAVRRHGGLTIADEVQVGYGRLGTWFWGFQQQGVVPDIVTIAKSAGAGYPVGAVVTRRQVAERYRTQGYFFSSTGGSPVSAVVGRTVLDIIDDEHLQHNARTTGAHLRTRLEALAHRHPLIGAVHGAGLYLGVEFVRDPGTLEPATEQTAAICERLLTLGVIMQPTGDHLNVLKIKPPLCLSRTSADYFVDMLDRTLSALP